MSFGEDVDYIEESVAQLLDRHVERYGPPWEKIELECRECEERKTCYINDRILLGYFKSQGQLWDFYMGDRKAIRLLESYICDTCQDSSTCDRCVQTGRFLSKNNRIFVSTEDSDNEYPWDCDDLSSYNNDSTDSECECGNESVMNRRIWSDAE